jgi:hypothetical protein
MFIRFFKYLRYKFFQKKKKNFKYNSLNKEKSISISYIEFEYFPYDQKSNFQFITKSNFLL